MGMPRKTIAESMEDQKRLRDAILGVPPPEAPEADQDDDLDIDGLLDEPAPASSPVAEEDPWEDLITVEEEHLDLVERYHLLTPHLTDIGYAERMKFLHGDDCRWCNPLHSWFVWDGTRWKQDDMERLLAMSKDVATKTTQAFALVPEKDEVFEEALEGHRKRDENATRGKLIRKAVGRESASSVEATLRMLKAEVVVSPDVWDRDPWLLNVPNGTLDLRTGELRGHRREDFITKMAGVPYNAHEECPQFLSFLDRVFDGDAGLIRYVQKSAGMSLSGEVKDHTFIILNGVGANGKTQFIKILLSAMGDYAKKAPANVITVSRGANAGAATPHLARLVGARFVSCSETEHGEKFAESLIKELSGGDDVVVRNLYQDSFQFTPQWTWWLDTNHLPGIIRGGHAMDRRLKLFPFNVTIPHGEQIPNIGAKLVEEEGPGILRWLVEGCMLWQDEGLGDTPKAIADATREYLDDENKIKRFIDEVCIVGSDREIGSSDLYQIFKTWCETEGVGAPRHSEFSKRLKEDHGISVRKTSRKNLLVGIELAETDDADANGWWKQ